MSKQISYKDIETVMDQLDTIRNERQTEAFLAQMTEDYEIRPNLYPAPISRSSFFRLLKKKNDIEALHLNQSAALKALHKYLKLRHQIHDIDEKLLTGLRFAENYFRTRKSTYTPFDIRALSGNYDMYRRFWRGRDRNLFMRSRVKISKFKHGYYLFSERQNWPKDDFWPQQEYSEINRGFLFPSGQSIISVCEALGGENTKFLTLNGFEPSLKITSRVNSFSGSAIASSDTPPNQGYGFHCVRSETVNKTCEILDIRDINHTILRNIFMNENYILDNSNELERKIQSI